MKRRIKQVTAFICAAIMAVSGCLIDGVIVSRADGTSTEENSPVIKFNNPGIGADVGEEINLSNYAVQFEDGVTTDATDVKWIGNGIVYKVPFASPAIPATAGETVDLSQYKVQFEENGDFLAVDSWEGVVTENDKFTPEKGVYQLTANVAGKEPKNVYVVAKNPEDKEHVLYFNDFGEEYVNDVDADGVIAGAMYSYNDFLNKDEAWYMTKIRQGASTCKYIVKDDKFYMYRDVTNYTTSNTHLLLPDWLGEFGNYKIEMRAGRNASNSNTSLALLGLEFRVNLPGNIEGTSNTTESQGMYDKYYYLLQNHFFGVRADGQCSVIYTENGQLENKNMTVQSNTKVQALNLIDNGYFVALVRVKDNTVAYDVTQKNVETGEEQTVSLDPTVVDGMPTVGRIGIYARYMKPAVDYIKVTLVDKLESEEVDDAILKSFTPTKKGVYELTAKTGSTTKTIYVVAKNPEDTEYVLWENNFESESDMPVDLKKDPSADPDAFRRIYGSMASDSYPNIDEEVGILNIKTSTQAFYRLPAWLGEFGNYRIQMKEQRETIPDAASHYVGIFARAQSTENVADYVPNYSVIQKGKYYDSDGIKLAKHNAWDPNASSPDKLSYTPIVKGKGIYLTNATYHTHDMLVQDNLIEYKLNDTTVVYDVSEREFSTGYLGLIFKGGMTATIDYVRVFFCPDVTTPKGPTSATYIRTSTVKGMAAGTVKVELPENHMAKEVACYWGNGTDKLADYAGFGKVLVPEGANSVDVVLADNMIIPEGATEIRVYAENYLGVSEEFAIAPVRGDAGHFDGGQEIMSFQIMSDTHITNTTNTSAEHLKAFLRQVKAKDPDSKGIMIGGDVVNNGKEEEYEAFNTIWDGISSEVGGLPEKYMVIGNHEFWAEPTYEDTMNNFNDFSGNDNSYFYKEVDGYKFIFLATTELTATSATSHTKATLGEEQIAWLKSMLEEKAKDDQPIFIFLHQPLGNTVAGTKNSNDSNAGAVTDFRAVKEVLKDYPQAFMFTSHSHMDMNVPNTMVPANDEMCNVFDTAGLTFLMSTHYTKGAMEKEGAQAYFVEVYKDKVFVRGRDIVADQWLPSAQYVVALGDNDDSAFNIEIGGDDVSYLDGSFDAYQYKKPTTKENSYAVTGPVKPSDYYTTEYIGQSAKGALKPTSIPGGNGKGGYSALTYKKSEMKNFVAEYEFYGGHSAITGLAFGGNEGAFPISLDGKANETGVLFYMTNNGYIYVGGAIDTNFDHIKKPSDVNLSTTIAGQEAFLEGTTFVRATRLVVNDNDKTLGLDVVDGNVNAESPTRTVCVKVQNGTLTIYDKEHADRVLEIPLTSAYDGGYVSLVSNTAAHGGFKRFNIQKLQEWDYDMKVKLHGNSVSYLDDAFDVYHYSNPTTTSKTGATLGPVEPSATYTTAEEKTYPYFTTGAYGTYANGGLKPTQITAGDNKGYAALTYVKDTVKDFEAEFDFYPGHAVNGIVFGGKLGTFPISLDGNNDNDTGVGIYVANKGQFSVWGAVDTANITTSNSVIVVNENPNNDTYGYMKNAAGVRVTKMTGETVDNSVKSLTEETDYYTVCVNVRDGVLTLYEKDHPNRSFSIGLTSKYKGGYVSLIANNTQSGAFGGFRFSKITENYDFRNSTLVELDQYFDSYYFETGEGMGEKGNTISEHWDQKQSNQGGFENLAIKPVHKNDDKKVSLLTLRGKEIKNFDASVEYYTSYVPCGMIVAPEGQLVTSKNGVEVLVNGDGKIFIEGAIEATTGSWSGEGESQNGSNRVISPALSGYLTPTDKNNTAEWKTRYVLNVRVQNGVLFASVDGFAGELSVKLTGNYMGGNISLYSQGRDQGGFWQFELETLDVLPVARANFPFDLTTEGDFVKIEVSTDAVYSKLIGSLKYDASKFEFVSAEIADETLNADVLVEANEGTIPLTMLINNNGGNDKLVTMYFKELVDTLDFTSFYVDDYDVLASGGVSAKRVDSPVEVENDHTEDKVIDVLDLVRGKKNSTEETTVDVAPIRNLLVGKSIYDASVSGAVVISEDVTVTDGDVLGTVGCTTIYRDCTLDFSGLSNADNKGTNVELVGSVILDNVSVENSDKVNLYANGYAFKVNGNVEFDSKSMRRLYGGKNGEDVFSTNLTLLSGKYTYIYAGGNKGEVLGDTRTLISGTAEVVKVYGGGYQADIYGNTYVTIAGQMNRNCDVSNHEATTDYFVFGGGYAAKTTDPSASVRGNTYVTVQDSAQAHLVYGGGCGANSVVEGVCNVDVQGGYVMGYYGGSRDLGVVNETNFVMTSGTTEQIFGGCDRYSMTGNVNVTVTGGEVQRRIYGGCYNDYDNDNDKWLTSYGVNGQVSVIIGGNANLSFDLKVLAGGIFSVKADNSLMAASRYSGEIENEIGILIFLDDSYADNSGKIGYHADSLVGLEDKFTDRHYDYLVKSNKGGTISVKENALNIVSNDGNSVTVSDGENVVYSASEPGNYILPALNNNSQKTLNVNFQ